jgi:hypothetical protein
MRKFMIAAALVTLSAVPSIAAGHPMMADSRSGLAAGAMTTAGNTPVKRDGIAVRAGPHDTPPGIVLHLARR